MRGAVAVLALLLLAGCSGTDQGGGGQVVTGTTTLPAATTGATTGPPECPTHWHATFALFLPGEGGEPARVDFASPRTPKGAVYYDLASGATAMTSALHMHQVGPEAGPAPVAASQLHMEANECTSVQAALRILEVDATASGLRLWGGHEQVAGQGGTFVAEGGAALRWWLRCAGCPWREAAWPEVQDLQLRHGESLLGALGAYTAAQVEAMQAQVPAPTDV